MPQLIKNVQGIIHENVNGSLVYNKSITSEIQKKDFINLNGMIAFLQNFSQTEYTEELTKPLTLGLVNQYNLPMTTLIINY
jgi:hypothetical protein